MPDLEPPAALEQATLAAMAAAAAAAEDPPRATARYLLRAAVWVTAIGIGAWLAVWSVGIDDPAEVPATAAADDVFLELAEQSMRLEEMLALIPPQRRIMRADTASTIVGLEDRIALIDAELYRAQSSAEPTPYREALMRDRVEVMNALVNVRYAQSRAFIF